MKLEQWVSLEKLKDHINDVTPSIAISMAKDMAYDIERSSKQKEKINSIFSIYMEMDKSELNIDRALSAIQNIFTELQSVESKKKFCSYLYPALI